MKQTADVHTMELPGLPTLKKRGRKPLFTVAMTATERKRRQRAKQKESAQ